MKSHERKAVENAVCKILDDAGWEMSSGQVKALPHQAVKLAQLRAGRTYGNVLLRDARDYARKLTAQARPQIFFKRAAGGKWGFR